MLENLGFKDIDIRNFDTTTWTIYLIYSFFFSNKRTQVHTEVDYF